jgi:hypothetical protein
MPYCFRPHSTHLTQPLDVVLFGPTQREYGLLVMEEMRQGRCVRKQDFNRCVYYNPSDSRVVLTLHQAFSYCAKEGFQAIGNRSCI